MRFVIFGAGGFIGSHLVEFLKKKEHYVIGIDRHYPRFMDSLADDFYIVKDIGDKLNFDFENIDGVFQLCAYLGGTLVIDSQSHDADIFMNNMRINLSVSEFCIRNKVRKVFFSSSACVYDNSSSSINPVNVYGWEKYSAEKLYLSLKKQYNIEARIGRLFNIYGPRQEYQGGRERVVSALCRKTYESVNDINIMGNGLDRRSFLHIDDCINAIFTLYNSNISEPINIGSDNLYSIDDMVNLILEISNKPLNKIYMKKDNVKTVRSCDNTILKSLDWKEYVSIKDGISQVYSYISNNMSESK
jgi:nucleoside-diphosphate-sugar epimerase